MKKSRWKPLWLLLSVIASVSLLLALLLSFGAIGSYRYNDATFTVGGGSVRATVREIEIDWLSGPVLLELSEDDAYPSVWEYADAALSERQQLRWKIDENGKLTVMARASTGILPSGEPAKVLIVRIPSARVQELRRLSLRVLSGAGHITLGALAPETELTVEKGEIKLTVPADAEFTLSSRGVVGSVVSGSEFSFTERDGTLVCGNGSAKLLVVAGEKNQELYLYAKKHTE